jgi:hypothetical protein
MTLLRDRRLPPFQTNAPLQERAALIVIAAFGLAIVLVFVGVVALLSSLLPAPAPPQRFTAPPFTLDFAAVTR